jgi:hypothetical protein
LKLENGDESGAIHQERVQFSSLGEIPYVWIMEVSAARENK